MTHNADQYRDQLLALQPRGMALPTDIASAWSKLLRGLADEFARIDSRIHDLQRDMNPHTTEELLGEWEAIFGLPDGCDVSSPTTNERRNALLIRMAAVGGQSRAYFIGLAAQFGLDITITEPMPFLVGYHGCGDPVGGSDWRFKWEVHVEGNPSSNTRTLLECAFNELKPSHTTVIFRYGAEPYCPPAILRDGSLLYDGTTDHNHDGICVFESPHDGSTLHDGSTTYGA